MNLSSRNIPPRGNISGTLTNDDILNKCLEAIRTNRATVADCVQQYPEFLELGALLHAAMDVHTLPKVELSFSSKSAMRQRILAHYDAQPIRKPAPTQRFNWRLWRRPAIALMATFIILFAGGTSLIQAASLAVPGDTLYGLKRTTEQIQLSLATGEARSDRLDQIANTRLNELTVLVARNNSLPDSVLNDASVSVSKALESEPNAAKRANLLNKTTNVMQQAAKSGAINPVTEAKILAAIFDGTDPIEDTPTATLTLTFTSTPTATLTLTATPTTTPTLTETSDTPSLTPSPITTDAPDGVGNTGAPKPTNPAVVPILPTHPPTPVLPTQAAGNPNGGNGSGGNGNGGNGNGNGNGKGGH